MLNQKPPINDADEGSLVELLKAVDEFHEVIYVSNKHLQEYSVAHSRSIVTLYIIVGSLAILNVVAGTILIMKGIL